MPLMPDYRHPDRGLDRDFASYGDDDWNPQYAFGNPEQAYWQHGGWVEGAQ